MIGLLDVAISGLGFVAGVAVGVKLMSGKVLALQSQVDERPPRMPCTDCETSKMLAAREKDLMARDEDYRRMARSNWQYLGIIKRMKEAEKSR